MAAAKNKKGQAKPAAKKKAVRMMFVATESESSEESDDIFGDQYEDDVVRAGSETLARRKTIKGGAIDTRSNKTNIAIDGTYMEFSRGGLRPQHQTQQRRLKDQIQEIGQRMMHSMTTTYKADVWEACEIPHPEHEREKERLAQIVQKEIEAEKAKQQFRGRAFAAPRRSRASISQQPEKKEEVVSSLHQEKAIAWLAKQSGWSVLDVEEVHDIFARHAQNGSIQLHGPPFQLLLQDIFVGLSEDEMKGFFKEIRIVRRQTEQWRRRGKHMDYGGDDLPEETKAVRFTEFYLALVAWLESHQMRLRGFAGCLLTRFSLQEEAKGSQQREEEVDQYKGVADVVSAVVRFQESERQERAMRLREGLLLEEGSSYGSLEEVEHTETQEKLNKTKGVGVSITFQSAKDEDDDEDFVPRMSHQFDDGSDDD